MYHQEIYFMISTKKISKDLIGLADRAFIGFSVLVIFQALLHRPDNILIAGAAA